MEEFVLKNEHLALLAKVNLVWREGENGAPAVDSKRPYGNSDAMKDIANILSEAQGTCPHCKADLSPGAFPTGQLGGLHRETLTAMEVIFQSGLTTPGLYVRDKETSPWRKP